MNQLVDFTIIADWLNNGPTVPLKTDSLFRLVWSDNQRELRLGTYTTFDIHGNSIGEVKKVEKVPKYPFIKERYILEMWYSPEVSWNPELPESINGCYEPIYVFEDAVGNILPIKLEVVQFIVKYSLKPKPSDALRKSVHNDVIEQREALATKKDLEILEDEGPLVSQFHDGTAVLNKKESESVIS